MLAIARALMMKPKLLILDEPTLGLAPVILETLSKALGAAAHDDPHQRAARRAERHLRAAACRPRLRARPRADRLGRIAESLQRRGCRDLSLGVISVWCNLSRFLFGGNPVLSTKACRRAAATGTICRPSDAFSLVTNRRRWRRSTLQQVRRPVLRRVRTNRLPVG